MLRVELPGGASVEVIAEHLVEIGNALRRLDIAPVEQHHQINHRIGSAGVVRGIGLASGGLGERREKLCGSEVILVEGGGRGC